jgi:hypothetical protein
MDNMAAMAAQVGAAQSALGALKPAYETATSRYNTNYYDPYSKSGEQSLSMMGNALGLNGAQGNQAAQSAFQAGPGYGFAMDQGLQALDRSAAARGRLGSGNHSADLMQYGQGLANQEYGNWLSRIGGMSQMGLSAAGGQTGRQGSLAGLDMGYGQSQANVFNNLGNNLSNMMSDQARMDQQRADQQQSNLFGGIMGGLKLGGSVLSAPYGGATVGSSLLGKLF